MDERDGFLRAIREEPDDDVHRLVFADWLDDRDEADWAALIRHQCGLARLLERSGDPFKDAGDLEVSVLGPVLRASVIRSLSPILEHLPATAGLEPERVFGLQVALFVRRGIPEHLSVLGDAALSAMLATLEQTRGDWGRSLRCLSFGRRRDLFGWSSYPPPFGPATRGTIRRFLRSRLLSNFSEVDLRNHHYGPGDPLPLPRRWPPNTRLWIDGRGVGMTADLERIRDRVGPCLVVEPEHPGDQALADDIPF